MGVRVAGVWHEELADPGTGGTDSGNGRNYSSMGDYNAAAGSQPSSPSSPSTPATPTTNTGANAVGASIQKMLDALASGNKQAFDETVREWNAQFGFDQQKFQDDVRRFNENLAITQAGLTGYYNAPGAGGAAPLTGYTPGTVVRNSANQFGVVGPNGILTVGDTSNPTIAQAIQANQGIATIGDAAFAAALPGAGQGVPTMAREQQTYNQQFGLTQLASQLQANPFQQAAVVGQANRILNGLPTAGFQAPNSVAGVGTVGGNTQGGLGYLQQIIDDIKDPTANQTQANDFLAQTPTPNKLDSASFLRSDPNTQGLILNAMQQKYGLDPQTSLQQIKNTLPQFNAPTTVGMVRRG